MALEDIGFYTLSDKRCKNASATSPLMRCELILTDKCNFKCPYCRKLPSSWHTNLDSAKETVGLWASQGLKNIRFSGGEPTVHPNLVEIVEFTKKLGIERIAVSTNGSANLELYKKIIKAGVNDLSISLDACCSAYGDKMAGVSGAWSKVVDNIRELSKLVYVTLGIVVTEDTISQLPDTLKFANSLKPSDIRIISSAQFNELLTIASNLPKEYINKYPILKYRINNIKKGRNVRGLTEVDSRRCGLCLDDMAVAGGYHFPCIIYMREGGKPIGKVGANMRQERDKWAKEHDTYLDPICRKNCLDVCIDYNNSYLRFKLAETELPRINPVHFTSELWRSGSIMDLDLASRYYAITSFRGRSILKKYSVGWCKGESLAVRPKEGHIALMCHKNQEHFWFHLRNNEFIEVFREEGYNG